MRAMKAIVYEEYGTPDVLRLAELPKPEPTDDQILIKIHAISINGADRENLVGKPFYARISGLRKPQKPILGSDIAGTVEAVGKNITEFQPGDEIFGEVPDYHGGFAEYVCVDGKTMAHKPESLSFEQASALPQAGSISYRGICSQGDVQPGQHVLINGAGGSGGSYAIQMAKLRGAEVTAVDHTNKLDFMRSLGADHVVDYTAEDYTTHTARYDLILDLIAHRSVFAVQRALKPGGIYYVVGGDVPVLLQTVFMGPWIQRAKGKRVRMLIVPQNREDVLAVTELVQAGKVTPVIDKTYPLEQVPDAFRYIVGEGSKGKVVITVGDTM